MKASKAEVAEDERASGAEPLRVGLIGRGIQGSRSPRLHMEEARALGLRLSYDRFDLDTDPWSHGGLDDALRAAQALGYLGVNVTYPFKQEVIDLLDEVSEDAARLGAVNTVLFRNGRRLGANTDWSGFAENFRRGLANAPARRVAQLGAGGAGAAAAYALLRGGVEILTVFDVDAARAEGLVDKLTGLFGEGRIRRGGDLRATLRGSDGLVNATPIGMANHPGSPAPPSLLRADMWVCDIVYVPIDTQLLTSARVRGCRTLDGGGMVVFQAADAFRLFTGREPDADRMRAAFLEDLRTRP